MASKNRRASPSRGKRGMRMASILWDTCEWSSERLLALLVIVGFSVFAGPLACDTSEIAGRLSLAQWQLPLDRKFAVLSDQDGLDDEGRSVS
jgi:hypothetical protein